MSLRTALRACALGLLACAATGSVMGQGLYKWETYEQRVESKKTVTALGSDLFGDAIDLQTGRLSFSATDVDLPGNDALPVRITRSYQVSNSKEMATDLMLADWTVELPRISGRFAPDWIINGSANRCSQVGGSPALPPGSDNYISVADFYQGIRLDIPGVYSGEVLATAAGVGKPNDGRTYHWTSSDGLIHLSCIPAANTTGEGFLAVTPDGMRYTFDRMAQRPMPSLRSQTFSPSGAPSSPLVFPTRENSLYLSRVEDRFGNFVTFTYTHAANQPARLSRIESSDQRRIDVTYSGGRVWQVRAGSSTSPAMRTWTYGYGTDTIGRSILSSVALPDGSSWSIQFAQLSHSPIVYKPASLEEGGGGPGGPAYRNCVEPLQPDNGLWPVINPSPAQLTGTIVHPSGAVARFDLALKEHGRTHVTLTCSNVTSPNNSTLDDHALFPFAWYDWSLTEKRISGPGLSALVWSYAYNSPWSFVLRGTGSSLNFPVCTLAGSLCHMPTCTSDSCATSRTRTTVTLPDGSKDRYAFGNAWQYNEGKLLEVERGYVSDTNSLEKVVHTYDFSRANQSYLARFGVSQRPDSDGFTSEYHRPQLKTVVTRAGSSFTREVVDGPDAGTLRDFDPRARPLRVTRSSSLGHSTTEVTAYHDHTSKWVMGQVASVTCVAPASCANQVPFVATFDPVHASPRTYSNFGRVVQTLSYYPSGQVYDIHDGKSQRTRLESWYRGVPRTVRFADSKLVTAAVDALGQIGSVTNELGYVTSYGYDSMGRLQSVTYPAGDSVAWTPLSLSFTRSTTAAYGLAAGHWRHMTTHGNYRREVYYDALWRPVLTREYDAANIAGTSRFTARAFDHAGRETFASYPVVSATSYLSPTQGVRTAHDALGRVSSVTQHSELGNLVSTTVWENGFRRRDRSPRGFYTYTNFQAFDSPDESSPVLVQAQIAGSDYATTSLTRDVYGKPTAITRSGTYQSASVSQTRNYVYDTYQRLCKRIDPESGASLFEYDAADNVAWETSGSSLTTLTCNRSSVPVAQRTYRDHDSRNRPTAVTYPDGSTLGFGYFADGALHTATTSEGINWTYGYNRRRLLISETSSLESMAFTHTYNALGHLASTSYPVGYVASFAPNALGQPTQVSGFVSAATYHPNGALKGFNFGNGIKREFNPNARGLPWQVRDSYLNATRLDYRHSYDANGNVTQISDVGQAGLQSRDMTYDGLDRLLTANSPQLFGLARYAYDPLDNLREADLDARRYRYVYNTSTWRPSEIRTHSGQLVWSLGFDARGNLTSKGSTGYQFDPGNRLRQIPSLSATYLYDAHGRRAGMITAAGGLYSLYTRDGKLRGGPDATQGARLWQMYLGNTLVGTRREPLNGAAASNTYHHTDLLGSPVQETSQSRTTVTDTRYAPYGEALNRTVDGPGYTGHRMDGHSGLVYMQQRYYDPVVGRFLSVDPVGVGAANGGNFNRYWYANNNPYKFSDPDGRFAKCGGSFCELWKGQDQGPFKKFQEPSDRFSVGENRERPADRREWTAQDEKDFRNEDALKFFDFITSIPSLIESAKNGDVGGLAVGIVLSKVPGGNLWRGSKVTNELAQKLGMDRKRLGKAIEEIKNSQGMRGDHNVVIDRTSGDVYDSRTGELLDNILDYK